MSLSVEIKKKFKDFTLDICFSTTERGDIIQPSRVANELENERLHKNRSNERLGILGASGCGKSMTLKCIAGIERPDEGKIVLGDRILYDSKKKINITPQKRNIGYLFQSYALFPNMTVEENIGCGLHCGKKEKSEIVDNQLELLRIKELKKRYPWQLSGGQQQRVALARILAYEPELLMLDEPFSALDYYLKDQLQQELLEALEFYKGEIIMVTHSRDEVYRFCENMMVVDQGRVLVHGGTKDLFLNPIKVPVAKLTGCKNISRIQKVEEHSYLALDWGVMINTHREVGIGCTHVGIRAHDIRIGSIGEKNSYACKQVKQLEGPFENTIIVSLAGEKTLMWKISKTYWRENLHEKVPSMLHISEESLMFLYE
ncbi:sulfate/molybdate ABC transporter ATP-binding protein [Anaeromicropila herbilytica]|uniref:ABC transporter n=1 Tax=Anaeromicropila herbilytica TaxID=2785025 RepID=A0A7R7IF97_9FIRM|nr:ATP-binding cassette domain-containing protein [Anaeromicropila herbilytica]BCN32871.1 ABC transporter [Anaeromicropila herbilytica]